MNKTEKFIIKAKKIHGDFYDYSKVVYVNCNTKVCIICPIHGEFYITPHNFLSGKGCKHCSLIIKSKKRSIGKENFIKRAIEIHGNKYNYSKVIYKNNSTKVCIICPVHGEFWQTPAAHLKGQGCPKCMHRSYKYSTKEFITKANKIHNNKYNYSKVIYVNNKTKVCITCPEHGEFWQTPSAHLRGQGCPKCADILNASKRNLGLKKFIELAIKAHGNKYDYSKAVYINNRTKICIICPIHGEFWIRPSKHLLGRGCPFCKGYKMEEKIKEILTESKIKFIQQYREEWLKKTNGYFLSVDFFLPDYNVAIECQGEQHFKSVDFFGGEEMFKQRIENDIIKMKKCKENNINLLYVIEKKYKTNMIDLYNNENTILLKKITNENIFDYIKA